MTLLAIKDYLTTQKSADLQQLAQHFQYDPSILRTMLQHWIRKGIIKTAPKPSPMKCQGCPTKCCKQSEEIYCIIDASGCENIAL